MNDSTLDNSKRNEAPRVDHRVRQLEQIVDQLQSFIEIQLSHWDAIVEGSESADEMRARAQQMLEQVECEQRTWDQRQAAKLAEFEAEADALAEAWRTVEAEQRRLAAKEALADVFPAAAPTAPMSAQLSAVQPTGARQPTENGGSPSTPNATDQQLEDSQRRAAAVDEFRKLSLEMAKHAKRNR